MSNSTDCTAFFTQNTDITGIGVRVAFYVQVTVVVLQTWFNIDDDNIINACWTLMSMSIGLMLAAIVSATHGQLSFFNAVQVQNLVCLAHGTMVGVAASKWTVEDHIRMLFARDRKRRGTLVFWVFYSQYILGGSLFIYLWVTGQRFGPLPGCITSMHFHVSFWRLKGSDSFHKAKEASFAIYTYIVLAPIFSNPLIYAVCRLLKMLLCQFYIPTPKPTEMTNRPGELRKELPWLRPWLQAQLHFANWAISMFFYIPATELLIGQDSQPQATAAQWTFGQILALVAIVPAVVGLLNMISDTLRRSYRRGRSERFAAQEADSDKRIDVIDSVAMKDSDSWVHITHVLRMEDLEAGADNAVDK